MTQKEIHEFLANTKVYVAGKSKEIQEKLFSIGYKWNEGNTDVSFTEYPFLYINKNHHISYGSDMCVFIEHGHHEITAEEILFLELPEPAYRPFKTQEECWNEMLKHQPFGWVKHKEKQFYANCIYVGNNGVDEKSFNPAYNDYIFADGTPFGIKED